LEKTGITDTTIATDSPPTSIAHGTVEEAPIKSHHLAGSDWLATKLQKAGVEVEDRGIERVPPTQREHTSTWHIMALWASANLAITNFSIGVIGPVAFGLGTADSCLTIFFFVGVANLTVAYLSTFGPKSGLRQMTVSRFAFGFYFNRFMAFINSLTCVGWSAVNIVTTGQVLSAVSNGKLPIPAGIVLLSAVTWFISMVGYKYVHIYERYSAPVIILIWFLLLGVGAPNFSSIPMPSGAYEAGNVLSFGCALVGGSLGWATFASDYNVNMPEETNTWKVAVYVWIGLTVPTVLIDCLGVAFGSSLATNTAWSDAYDAYSLGGLLTAGFGPLNGFGTFLVIILSFSVIAGNIPNSYSLALSFQNVHPWFIKVPRWMWTSIGTVIYIGIAIAASYDFIDSLVTFMSLLSYFLAMYTIVVIEEHLIFRKRNWKNYDLDGWNNKLVLPLGYAGGAAFCCGMAGVPTGMAQVWYIGPIGGLIGDPSYGGDIAFELAMTFTGITYPLFRMLEIKYTGR